MDNELMHYGVLGMKWGVRKSRKSSGTRKRKSKSKLFAKTDTNKKPAAKPQTTTKKSIKNMSDEELEAYVNKAEKRLNLEKRYRDLTPKETSKGKKFVETIMKDMVVPAAKDVGKQFIKSQMTKAVNKKFDLGDEYKIYTNNKKK